jgi:hypothetical protein
MWTRRAFPRPATEALQIPRGHVTPAATESRSVRGHALGLFSFYGPDLFIISNLQSGQRTI